MLKLFINELFPELRQAFLKETCNKWSVVIFIDPTERFVTDTAAA